MQIPSWKQRLIEQAAGLFSKKTSPPMRKGILPMAYTGLSVSWRLNEIFCKKAQSLSLAKRKEQIEPHRNLSQVRQCQLLNLACSTYDYSAPRNHTGAQESIVPNEDRRVLSA
ncbi:hypothetical protein SAMN05428978_1004106 [Nitrosomonas sp. Nm34]|nr:hypothetical protein SAMN05428978_1004106 [Nitrosomonas sp. Nm34]